MKKLPGCRIYFDSRHVISTITITLIIRRDTYEQRKILVGGASIDFMAAGFWPGAQAIECIVTSQNNSVADTGVTGDRPVIKKRKGRP